ncbi:MAG: helix-turn-helix domain-containing protein [Ancrocorticia populi]|uniref:helix-turn-helix domain-containing protein n=1 Tax=Ancrocorticia populi TaxID=2175228 RepID=UPI003F8DEA5C
MDVKSEVSEFLRTRRAKVTPEQVGLPRAGQRRVAGLRRGEVAALAGISVEYYAKLERGQIAGASEAVLDAIADALVLDAAERVHLKDLARAAGSRTNISSNASSRSASHTVRPALRQIIDSVADAVVFVRDDAQNIVAINDLGR